MESPYSQDLIPEASQAAHSIAEGPEMQTQKVQDSMDGSTGTALDGPQDSNALLADCGNSKAALAAGDTTVLSPRCKPRRPTKVQVIAKELQNMMFSSGAAERPNGRFEDPRECCSLVRG